MSRGGAHGFTLNKKHLTLYWSGDRYGYGVELSQNFGGSDGGRVSTPRGLYHLLRQVGSKGCGIYQPDVHALIRAMGKRFNWTPAEVRALLRHGAFNYQETNGEDGECHYENAWLEA